MAKLWVMMSDAGGEDEVIAEVDTIDDARAALAQALRLEADDRDDWDGELYRLNAEAVEKLWQGRLNEDLEVGVGSGLDEREWKPCHDGDCDLVPEVSSVWTVTDRDPDARFQSWTNRDGPRKAPRRYEDDEHGPAWEPYGAPVDDDEPAIASG